MMIKKYIKFASVLILGVVMGGFLGFFSAKEIYQEKLDFEMKLNEDSQNKIREIYEEELYDANALLNKELKDKPKKEYKIYKVNDLKEFVDALGDDRIIEISGAINITKEISQIAPLDSLKFDFSGNTKTGSISSSYTTNFYDVVYCVNLSDRDKEKISLPNDFEGYSITIKNTKNLTIKGVNKAIEILIENSNAQVLGFNGNKNLTIKELTLFHDLPVLMDCGIHAPVISFRNDRSVIIEDCSLNGSGTDGISASGVDFVKVNRTKIFNCSETAISLDNVTAFEFKNGEIIDNNLYNLFEYFSEGSSYSSTEFNIVNTKISNNTARYFVNDNLKNGRIKFDHCNIHDNTMDLIVDYYFNDSNNIYANKK